MHGLSTFNLYLILLLNVSFAGRRTIHWFLDLIIPWKCQPFTYQQIDNTKLLPHREMGYYLLLLKETLTLN